MDIKFRNHMPFAVQAAVAADLSHAIHHQHRWFGQLRIPWAKELATGAFQKTVFVERGRKI
jgi:hypothetical protein